MSGGTRQREHRIALHAILCLVVLVLRVAFGRGVGDWKSSGSPQKWPRCGREPTFEQVVELHLSDEGQFRNDQGPRGAVG